MWDHDILTTNSTEERTFVVTKQDKRAFMHKKVWINIGQSCTQGIKMRWKTLTWNTVQERNEDEIRGWSNINEGIPRLKSYVHTPLKCHYTLMYNSTTYPDGRWHINWMAENGSIYWVTAGEITTSWGQRYKFNLKPLTFMFAFCSAIIFSLQEN